MNQRQSRLQNLPELVKSDAAAKIHILSRKKRSKGGLKVVDFQVDYHDPASMQRPLKGVDALINTMGTEGGFAVAKRNLVEAAAKSWCKNLLSEVLSAFPEVG